MKSELQRIFEQGDAELQKTAGEPATFYRKDGSKPVKLRVVISPAAVAIELPAANGSFVTCDRVALIRACDLPRKPEIGDRIDTGRELYKIHRVTEWAHDTSWHADLALTRR